MHPAPRGEAVSPEPLGPPGSGTPAHLCLRTARAGLAQGLQKEQMTAPGPVATQGPRLGGHTTEPTAGSQRPQARAECGQCYVTSRPGKQPGRGGAGSPRKGWGCVEGAGLIRLRSLRMENRQLQWPGARRVAAIFSLRTLPNHLLGKALNKARSAQHGSKTSPLCRPVHRPWSGRGREGRGRRAMRSGGRGGRSACLCSKHVEGTTTGPGRAHSQDANTQQQTGTQAGEAEATGLGRAGHRPASAPEPRAPPEQAAAVKILRIPRQAMVLSLPELAFSPDTQAPGP